MCNKSGFHRIEVQIEPNRWVAISNSDYWFGGEHPDSIHVASRKAYDRVEDRRHEDPRRTYRIVTNYE